MKGLLLGISLLLALPGARADDFVVFAAASLKNALDAVVAAYPGPHPAISYAASSTLARQVERGAPAALFISADVEWMDYLEKKGLIQTATRVDLLGNGLVWIVPASQPPVERPLDALGATGRLALADPAYVPAGKYARAALENMGLWSRVSARIAPAANVRAALALVARGEAPLGIVYATDARVEPRVRVLERIDPSQYPPIVYPAALVRGAGENARAFLDYLQSNAARRIFESQGFRPLNSGRAPHAR